MAKVKLKNYETRVDCPVCEKGQFTYRLEEIWWFGFLNPVPFYLSRTCNCRLRGEHYHQIDVNIRYNWKYGERLVEV